ncbi:MAG: hypothetical protein A3K19_19730 [Lentisphaerae bacterium RIFOXYB12_FULL_65_16]|nr:MAG: hypothetical protein A3K18_31085 [Lentisphaerae bacterium RIFOXYA12_64_32]OGV92092.1 MAG: hypothetical protein A3K19_19730 [Lentisphaerae bacterium RIFOXYB12_FULL_65_16]
MKTSHPITDKLVSRIHGKGRGTVFSSADFVDLGSRAAVDQALSRLVRQGAIRRIARGLYDYPRVNPALGGTLSPSPDAVAKAVARRTDSRLIPTGALAANALGLSTQVPAKMIYLTDGPQRQIQIGSQTLVFRHASPRTMAVSGRVSAVVFQALRYLGRTGVTPDVVQRLRATIPPQDRQRLGRDIRHAVGWMRPILTQISTVDGDK